jgi:ElaB/YqjD/DUF883 family membrane-anchored ribosome-binding protein
VAPEKIVARAYAESLPANDDVSRNEAPGPAGTNGSRSAHAAAPPADWVQRAAGNAHDMIDRVAEQAAPRVRRMQRHVNEAGQRLQSGGGNFSAWSSEWAESARCTVREQPFAALATAAAVGWLLGRLSR